MAEMARLAIVLSVPIISELDLRRVAALALAVVEQALVVWRGQEHEGVAVLLVDAPASLFKTQPVAIEVERAIEIADAEHGVQVSHGLSSPSGGSGIRIVLAGG